MATEAKVCPFCGGTGWRIHEIGGLSGAERCDCFKVHRAARLVESANVPANYTKASFENFSIVHHDKQQETRLVDSFKAAYDFAERFPQRTEKPGLLFVGPTGAGKTHLAVAVMRRLMQKGFESVFFGYQELLEKLKSSYDPAYGAALRESYQRALECEVLVLDDLGAYRVTDWVLDTVTHLITVRCNERRPVIATTNLVEGRADLTRKGMGGETDTRYLLGERIGERARSRLMEMCSIIRMHGISDYRERPVGR
ncbi:MAG: ATP-binding protein [Bryobacterales bacterium]|nr:ATP-binding protein [Bryobacterales bacterium]